MDCGFTEDTLHRFIDWPSTMFLIQTIDVQCRKVEGGIGNRSGFMITSVFCWCELKVGDCFVVSIFSILCRHQKLTGIEIFLSKKNQEPLVFAVYFENMSRRSSFSTFLLWATLFLVSAWRLSVMHSLRTGLQIFLSFFISSPQTLTRGQHWMLLKVVVFFPPPPTI